MSAPFPTKPKYEYKHMGLQETGPFMLPTFYAKRIYHLAQRDKDALKQLLQSVTGEDITGQVTINLSQGGINSVESTQMVKDEK